MAEPWEENLVRNVSKATQDLYTCPRCHYRFSLFQSRGIACIGCREAVLNCPKVRCPKCDYDFMPFDKKKDVENAIFMKDLSLFIKRDMKRFGERFG